MEQANETGDSEKFDALLQRVYDLGKNWVPNMPRWLTAFRTSTRNRKSVRRLVRRWMRSITCVEGDAPSTAVQSRGAYDRVHNATSAGPNLVPLTPLWTRTAHVVPLRMVRCRFPKLRYG